MKRLGSLSSTAPKTIMKCKYWKWSFRIS